MWPLAVEPHLASAECATSLLYELDVGDLVFGDEVAQGFFTLYVELGEIHEHILGTRTASGLVRLVTQEDLDGLCLAVGVAGEILYARAW